MNLDDIVAFLAEHKVWIIVAGLALLVFGSERGKGWLKTLWEGAKGLLSSKPGPSKVEDAWLTGPITNYMVLKDHFYNNAKALELLRELWKCFGDPPDKP